MLNIIFRSIYMISFFAFVFSADISHAKTTFKDIIAFGDSLTDVGNVAGVTVPGNAPRINGYFEETHFSDGIIWNEWVAQTLGLPAPTPGRGNTTTLPPLPNGDDWAWGGAESAAGSDQPSGVTEPIPNLLLQVQTYLAVNTPRCSTLFAIWAGADNLLVAGKSSPAAAQAAVNTIIQSIQLLEAAGARNFLIFNLPQLGDTPAAMAEGRLAELAADVYSESFNLFLKDAIKALQKDHCFKAKIFFVDIFSEFVLVVDTVNSGGTYVPSFFVPGPPVAINNVTDEALIVFQSTGTFPTNYLFWDDVHPTTQGHQVVAGLVLKALRHPHHKKCDCETDLSLVAAE